MHLHDVRAKAARHQADEQKEVWLWQGTGGRVRGRLLSLEGDGGKERKDGVERRERMAWINEDDRVDGV